MIEPIYGLGYRLKKRLDTAIARPDPRRVAATGKICSMPIPADLSEAFDQAVKELIAWDGGGDEPSVNVGGRPMLISMIAGLAETLKDAMPAGLFWRMVGYANRPDRMSGASELSHDSSYATGAWCLLQWVQNKKEQFGKLRADRTDLRRGSA
jgi:hypothetical protein